MIAIPSGDSRPYHSRDSRDSFCLASGFSRKER